jgi:hypothetical protein
LVFQLIGLNDFLDRTHGHSFFDNASIQYTSALMPPELLADLNSRVERHQRAPDAGAYLENYYEPSGQLLIPVLALHTTRDPVAT